MKFKFYFILFLIFLLIGSGIITAIYFQKKQQQRMAEQAFLLAMTAYEKKQYDIAEGKFKELIEKYPGSKNILQANLVLARIYKHKNNIENAVAVWQKLVKDFPQSNQIAEALIELANYQYYNKKNYEESKKIIEDVLQKYPNSEFSDMANLSLAVYYRDRGSYEKAKELLDQALVKFPNGSAKNDIENVLGDVNFALLTTRNNLENDEIYVVQKGDKITTIAKKYNIADTLLMKSNGITNPSTLRPGRRLKIPKVNFRIIVDKFNNTLTLYNNDKYFKKYPVRTGVYEYQTPAGKYKIESKVKNPDWNKPDTGEKIHAGDPRNELGTRWMGFEGSALGIHGTIKPETIGKYASNGCIGLYIKDVEELYDLVPLGTEIEIIGKQNPDLIDRNNIGINQ